MERYFKISLQVNGEVRYITTDESGMLTINKNLRNNVNAAEITSYYGLDEDGEMTSNIITLFFNNVLFIEHDVEI